MNLKSLTDVISRKTKIVIKDQEHNLLGYIKHGQPERMLKEYGGKEVVEIEPIYGIKMVVSIRL